MIYFCVKFQKNPLFGNEFNLFAPWLPWQWLPFWICSTTQKLPHTTVDIPTNFHEVWWKESNLFLNPPPLFCFHGNCGKVCPTDSDFFGLSRSTRCGCCSFHLSSISVLRVTCYDHFCVFHFFFLAFWPFPWQQQPFWKNQPLKPQLHMIYDIPTRFHKVWSRHLRTNTICLPNFVWGT